MIYCMLAESSLPSCILLSRPCSLFQCQASMTNLPPSLFLLCRRQYMECILTGAVSGSAGLLVGGVAGVVRGTPAIFFAAASGIQWFGLGTTFWGSRSFILQAWDTGKGVTPSERVSASTAAGAVAGSGIGLLTREPLPFSFS